MPGRGQIVGVSWPREVSPGSTAEFVVQVMNTGDERVYLIAGLQWWDGGITGEDWTAWIDMPPGAIFLRTLSFAMPAVPVSAQVLCYRWFFDYPADVLDDTYGPVTVAAPDADWEPLALPQEWRDFLEGGTLNWEEGRWFDLFGVAFPPFNFLLGNWILSIADVLIGSINWVLDKAKNIFVTANAAFYKAWEVATSHDDWISGAAGWFLSQVEGWWSSAYVTVQGWVNESIDVLGKSIEDIQADIASISESLIGSGPSLDDILAWVADRLGGVEPFKTFIEWALMGYNLAVEIKDEALEFFSDPAGWIFVKISDWLNEEVEP